MTTYIIYLWTILYCVQYCFIYQRNSVISLSAPMLKMIHLSTILDENIQMFSNLAESCLGIIPSTSFEQLLHFLAQTHAWNACGQAQHWCNELCCSNDNSSQQSAFIQWTQYCLPLLQNSISTLIFLREMWLLRLPLPAFTFLTHKFETLCILALIVVKRILLF